MEFIMKTIINKILSYDKISIFFHEIPDFDALGSSYALKRFIKDVAPEKEVEIIGVDVLNDNFSSDFFEFDKKHVPNTYLGESLGIILDTANSERIWTGRQVHCKELLRIDHHPQVESMAQTEWIDSNYPATAQMIGELLYEWDANQVLAPTAMYLYGGLITDTNRFLNSNTIPSTYVLAGKLVQTGFDRQKIHDAIYLRSIKEIKFDSYVIDKVKYDDDYGFAYAIIPKNAFKHFDIDLRMSYVHVLNNILNLEVWATLYYDDTVKSWRGSLRSRTIPINMIAEKYNGGGHALAAGFTLKTRSQFKEICKEVITYLKEYQNIIQ